VLLGVSCLASKMPSAALVHVTLNDKKHEIINFNEGGLKVLSVLVSAGIQRQKITGRVGLAKTFVLNGVASVIKGGPPQSAKVLINGEPAALDAALKEGDRIDFTPAFDGVNARAAIAEVMSDTGVFVLNGQEFKFPVSVTVDGRPVSAGDEITDNAKIEVKRSDSLAPVLAAAGVRPEELSEQTVSFDVLGARIEKKLKNCALKINGREIRDIGEAMDFIVGPGDQITFERIKPVIRAGDLVSVPGKGRDLKVKINEEEFVFPGSCGKILLNGREVAEDAEVNDGDIIRTAAGRDAEAVLVDIFRYISLEPRDTAGKRLKLLVNQQEANFTTPLSYDADVRISFE